MYVETFKDFNVFKGWYHVQGLTITTWKCLLSLNYAFITVSITVHCGLWHPSSLIVIWYYLPWVSHFMIPKPFHLGISLPNHGGFYPGTDPRNRKEACVNLQWGDCGLSEKQSPIGKVFYSWHPVGGPVEEVMGPGRSGAMLEDVFRWEWVRELITPPGFQVTCSASWIQSRRDI